MIECGCEQVGRNYEGQGRVKGGRRSRLVGMWVRIYNYIYLVDSSLHTL